jgi:hypothetical protein
MSRELRRIFLSNQEVADALSAFRKLDARFLPPGKICEVQAGPENVTVRIEMKYIDNLHVLDFKIPYVRLTDILVNYCVERSIPVPRMGKKGCILVENEVVLEIAVSNEQPHAGVINPVGGRSGGRRAGFRNG